MSESKKKIGDLKVGESVVIAGTQWAIYIVANHTLQEIYIGVLKGTCKDDLEGRWEDHCSGDTETLEHWDCGTHNLELLCCIDNVTNASEKSHKWERDKVLLAKKCPEAGAFAVQGYKVFRTRGI